MKLEDRGDSLRARTVDLRKRLRTTSRELAESRARLAGPSHHAAMVGAWRERLTAEAIRAHDECLQFDSKLFSYAFAQSHGVGVPELFDRWDALDDLRPEELVGRPERTVLKSAVGTAAKGVAATTDLEELRATIARWRSMLGRPARPSSRPRIDAPFFTEEELGVDAPGALTDIKAYAFYGEVHLVMLMAPEHFRDRRNVRVRYLTASGDDLGPVSKVSHLDPDLPVPRRLDLIVQHASRLSRSLKRPFVRLDFYEVGDRVILGEITPWPGHGRVFEPSFDVELGRQWDLARVRLRSDLTSGVSPLIEWGPHPRHLRFMHAPPWSP